MRDVVGRDAMDRPAAVLMRGLSRQFGTVPAVHDITLDVAQGEFLALVGPSGAGKTTLLRVIAGLELGYSGTLSIAGRDMAGVAARDRRIGFVFQSYALFRHMTVAENVAFGLRVRPRASRPRNGAIEARARELLALVQIPELAARYPGQLSGGQRQRVALARALAIEPALLLLDEPFGALDPLVRKDIRSWLRSLQKQLGVTAIFVTHDQSEALEMADRVAILCGGRLEQVDTPEALYANPASRFVHQFLGESLSFAGSVANGVWRPDEAGVLPLPTTLAAGRATAVIRPHEVGLATDGTGARIAWSRAAGAYRRSAIELAERTVEVLAPVTLAAAPVGSECRLDLREARLFLDHGLGA